VGLEDAFAAARHDDEPALLPADPVLLLASPRAPAPVLREALRCAAGRPGKRLLDRLIHHRVDGLAWRSIASLPKEGIDPWLRATLRRRHEQRAAATLAQGLALCEVLERLDRTGIPVVVMRGLRAIEWIYKDAGARPFEDHDLLIRPGDDSGARSALTALGYGEAAPGLFRRATVSIDLHTDPIGARRRPSRARLFPIDVPALFRDADPGWVGGGPALLLTPEDDVLLLALHLVKHSFDRLIRTADLAHLVAERAAALCWEAVREKAERARSLRIVGLALAASESLGVVAPPVVRLAEPESLFESLLLRQARALRPLPYSGDMVMALGARSLRDRLRFLFDAVAPRGEAQPLGRTAADLPRRAVVLLDGAMRQMRERRQAR
jgi:hypothetical protein